MTPQPKPPTTSTVPAFQQAIQDYADSVVALEKEEFKSGLESFESHASKIRNHISSSMHAFYDTYHRGYAILFKELERSLKADALDPFRSKVSNIKLLEDPMAFMNFLSSGHSIYELLGFTPEVVSRFYEVAHSLVEAKRYEEARDSFYFLVTIAPMLWEAWLGLGYCYAQCKEPNAAIQACCQAVDIMPTKPDAYLTFARVCIEMQDFEQAKKICDVGIAYAKEHHDLPWAKELIDYMEEAKRQTDVLFQKSQYQSFSS